jgi:hypothetical protein
MKMPGFTAASSLDPTMGRYWGNAVHSRISGGFVARLDAVKPQQSFGVENTIGNCFGNKCVEDFCSGLTGQSLAKCKAACAQPSKCGGCSCTCAPNCARTCLRSCTKSTPSAFLRCTGPCFGDPVAQL